MTETPTAQAVCCENHDHTQTPCEHAKWFGKEGVEWIDNGKTIIRPLTAEEIAQREADAAAYAAMIAEQEAEAAAKEAEKERIAGALGITLDELKVLLS